MIPVLPHWNVPRYNESFNKKRNRKSDSAVVIVEKNDDFPHKYKIQAFLGLIFVLLLLLIISYVYFMSCNTDYRPSDFYDPCGAPNILSVDEVIKMKSDLDKTTKVLKEIIAIDLPPETQPAVSQKLKQITHTQQKLSEKVKYQIQHRKICYQNNVERYLKENDSQQQIINVIYISFQALFLFFLCYYIFEIYEFKFTPKQKNSYKLYICLSVILLIIHVIFGIFVVQNFSSQNTFDKNRIKSISDF